MLLRNLESSRVVCLFDSRRILRGLLHSVGKAVCSRHLRKRNSTQERDKDIYRSSSSSSESESGLYPDSESEFSIGGLDDDHDEDSSGESIALEIENATIEDRPAPAWLEVDSNLLNNIKFSSTESFRNLSPHQEVLQQLRPADIYRITGCLSIGASWR